MRAVQPAPAERAGAGVDGQQQVGPLVLELEALRHVHPAPGEHPAHLAAQAQPQLVGIRHAGVARHAGPDERGPHPPCRQASCAATSAFSATGHGTFGRTPSRCSALQNPPGR
jgi:hypothetical protein